MVGDEMDEKGLSLWSLERTVKENANHLSPYLLFADFLIDSHFYGLKYESPQESSVYAYYFADMEPQRVANSLDEFFYFHINDPSKLGLMGES